MIDLIENKILFLIDTSYDDYDEYASLGAEVKLKKHVIDFIDQNNLLESWEKEGSLEEEQIDSPSIPF